MQKSSYFKKKEEVPSGSSSLCVLPSLKEVQLGVIGAGRCLAVADQHRLGRATQLRAVYLCALCLSGTCPKQTAEAWDFHRGSGKGEAKGADNPHNKGGGRGNWDKFTKGSLEIRVHPAFLGPPSQLFSHRGFPAFVVGFQGKTSPWGVKMPGTPPKALDAPVW